ncbi:anti-phage-associated helicase HerA [uncultured Novosphingobium sp.]|uniref:anti-phage-associated helicase HerA n=1 Tax=uncultured Novosphingobium sp. TaxID=292277 RepID=UPI0025954F63|nr:anti-phage-associated helicase HerA [uncultured Novosphingobium sp.]
MSSRRPIGYVVEIDGPQLLVNLLEDSRGHVAGHRDGLSTVEQPGDLVGIDAGAETIILRIMSVAFAEPREVHAGRGRPSNMPQEPLRQLRGRVVGYLAKRDGKLAFSPQEWRLPVLGASVYPLSDVETIATIGANGKAAEQIKLGSDSRNRAVEVSANIDQVLGRHMAILGSTGQGKTHFVAAVLQQLLRLPKSRIVVFDVNGEYAPAFANLGNRVKVTQLGGPHGGLRIPYYALGRHGLSRLLIPSEKAQMPALRFAIEHLTYVEADANGARLVNGAHNSLYDDCHSGSPAAAMTDLNAIRNRAAPVAQIWPHMRALSCLATEWYVLSPARNNTVERNAFQYGHIQSMINRIRGLIEDPQFTSVVNVAGGAGQARPLDMNEECARLVDQVFGPPAFGENDWSVHIIDLSRLTQDLMPFVLGSLLEMFAAEIFKRGPGNTHPTMLALEEAHHYLRQLPGESDGGQQALAYERLAKEGRKFGLSLLISTQRPSEVSSTVLSQCGTWAVFRLNNEADQRAVASAAETAGVNVSRQLAGLGRGEAIIFGAALPVPTRLSVSRPAPEPDSKDPPFLQQWSN